MYDTFLLRHLRPINAHNCQNQPDNFDEFFEAKAQFTKYLKGEILIRILPTTLLQIFHKIIPNSKVIVQSIINPDNNFWMKSQVVIG